MTPRSRPHARCQGLLALLLLVVLAGCGGEDGSTAERLVPTTRVLKLDGEPRQTAPDPSQQRVRRGRIQLERPQERLIEIVDGANPVETRVADGLILSDIRDGLMSAHGAQFELDLPAEVAGTLRVDLAVLVNDGGLEEAGALPAGLAMEFRVGLAGEGVPPRALLQERVAVDPGALGWRAEASPLVTAGLEAPKLVFQSVLVADDPAAVGGDLVRFVSACWGNPAVIAESGAESVDGPGEARVPNVIVLTIDTLRADHLSCYGYERPTSPNIDALVARGALFENAISAAPWTLPSYGALFTGRYPSAHRAGMRPSLERVWGKEACGSSTPPPAGVMGGTRQLAQEYVTLAEALQGQGYRTGALVNNPFLHASRGVDQGFERYAWYQYTADDGVDAALTWIDEQQGAPFFLFLHLMDPHMPYAPPPPFDERFGGRPLTEVGDDYPWQLGLLRASPDPESWKELLIGMYDGEIAYTDQEVGRFVEALAQRGMSEDTLLVLHSDHGEEFWDHGGYEHGHALYDELLHVPLAVVYPRKVPAKTRVAARVRTVDVFPTVLELVGLERDDADLDRGKLKGEGATLNARSLVPWIEGERDDELETLSEGLLYGPPHAPWWEAKARCEGDLKLIIGGPAEQGELYDLGLDPGETQNLIRTRSTDAEGLAKRLFDAALTLGDESPASDITRPPPEVIEAMIEVGYAGEGDEEEPEPDPEPGATPGGR